MQKILEIKNLSVNYPVSSELFGTTKEYIHALNNVSLDIYKGEVLGLVGESGCGKSTLGKAALRLISSEGNILFNEKNIKDFNKKEIKTFRKNAQLIFQNPFSSLNPRMTVREILQEPLIIHGVRGKTAINEKILNILKLTGLDEETLSRYPHEFSGGQRQRIAIARALILRPVFLVADEPVSALDVSIQAQIIKLLMELKDKMQLTILFVSHDLGVVKYISDRVAVMYLGEIVEIAASDELFKNPKHPYTKALLSAVPTVGSKKYTDTVKIEGDLPSPKNPPKACKFHTRCPFAMKICSEIAPEYTRFSATHKAKCHLFNE